MDTNKMPARIFADSKPTIYDEPHGAMSGIWDTHETEGDIPYVRADLVREAMGEAVFLLQRLAELEIPDDLARDWIGHVDPSISRLSSVLAEMKEAGL